MTQTIVQPRSTYNWPLLFKFIVLFAVIGFLFRESLSPLSARWVKWDQDLSHAIPTLMAFLFLISRTHTLPYNQDSKNIRFFLIVALAALSLAWLLFLIANLAILANTTILICLPLVIAAAFSVKTARALLPLFGILIFTIPLFSQLNDTLVQLSASAVGFLVKLVGMTALIDGQNIFIASGHIYIADGCSGLRYLTISMLLGYLLAILNYYDLKRTLFTLFISILLGIATNWLRIFSLVIIGDLTEMKSSLMQDHEVFGWILFSCVMLPAIFFAPIRKKQIEDDHPPAKLRALLPLLALATGPLIIAILPTATQDNPKLSLTLLTSTQEQTLPKRNSLIAKIPESPWQESRESNLNGTDLNIQLAQYRPASLKEKIIPYFESLYNHEEWNGTKIDLPKLAALGFQTLKLKRFNSNEQVFLLYRFEVGAYNSSGYQKAKMLQIPATFAHKRYSNFFSISARCPDNECGNEMQAAIQLANEWHEKTKDLR